MDGAVPHIYITLVLGVGVSLILTLAQLWFVLTNKKTYEFQRKKLNVSKYNIYLASFLLATFIYFHTTIIGYGPLRYVIPVQFLFVLLIYIRTKKSGNSNKNI